MQKLTLVITRNYYHPLLLLNSNTMNYWFYLEPYTFVFSNEREAVIYNTLNSAYLVCPTHPTVKRILEQWENASAGYGTMITEEEMENEIVRGFVNSVRESFSGDCIEYNHQRPTPYLFKPDLFLNTDIRIEKEKEKSSLGERIMQDLHEMTVYLPASCSCKCTDCASYYKQFNHCTICQEETLKLTDYTYLLRQLHISGIQRVNLLSGGDPLKNSNVCQLLSDFAVSSFKKHLYVDFNFLSDKYIEWIQQTQSILEVQVRLKDVKERIVESMRNYSFDTIKWNLIVSEGSDIECLDNWFFPEGTSIQVHPFYSGDNFSFFDDYVFTDLEDILAEPVDRKAIFRHKALNDNFFGKLTLFPSGEVYSNVNCPSLGNIQNMSLKELVYKELTEGYSWLKVRGNETPCSQCINKHLCPSISNYELVIGRNNLCKVKSE